PLGHLQFNPAPRTYKGGRGTPLENHPTTDHQIHGHRPSYHLSTGIIQPQTGRRVLPPPEGPNLSKTLCLLSSVLCYHLTCDPMTHHINSIAGKKHRQLARQVGVLSRSSQQVRWLRSTSARPPSPPAWSSASGAATSSPAST